jgi:hypothetical protein
MSSVKRQRIHQEDNNIHELLPLWWMITLDFCSLWLRRAKYSHNQTYDQSHKLNPNFQHLSTLEYTP